MGRKLFEIVFFWLPVLSVVLMLGIAHCDCVPIYDSPSLMRAHLEHVYPGATITRLPYCEETDHDSDGYVFCDAVLVTRDGEREDLRMRCPITPTFTRSADHCVKKD